MKKVTKKQRKLIKGGNAMVKYSLRLGVKIGEYIGANPVYRNKAAPHQPVDFVKVQNGLPFIRKSNHLGV